MSNLDGGPAFPVHGGHSPDDDPRNRILGGGMTLRDWFAGQALAGTIHACLHDTVEPGTWHQHVARNAYEMADAMIRKARAERGVVNLAQTTKAFSGPAVRVCPICDIADCEAHRPVPHGEIGPDHPALTAFLGAYVGCGGVLPQKALAGLNAALKVMRGTK